MKTIDLVVPCYNEEEGLEHFVLETNKVIDTIPDYSFRYILINDGSKDKTYLVMKKLAARFSNIKYMQACSTATLTMWLLWTPICSIRLRYFLR